MRSRTTKQPSWVSEANDDNMFQDLEAQHVMQIAKVCADYELSQQYQQVQNHAPTFLAQCADNSRPAQHQRAHTNNHTNNQVTQ